MSDIWYLNGKPVNNFPGEARVESVGHMMADAIEIGISWYWWDPRNVDDMAYTIQRKLEGAR